MLCALAGVAVTLSGFLGRYKLQVSRISQLNVHY